jgi:hypothetical protein
VSAHLGGSAPLATLPKCPEQAAEFHCCGRMALWRKTQKMPISEMDRSDAEAMDGWDDFQEGLASEQRKYPIHDRTYLGVALDHL